MKYAKSQLNLNNMSKMAELDQVAQGVADHINIGNDVVVGGGSGIAFDIPLQ